MEYSTHVFIQQTPITEQNFELKYARIPNRFSFFSNLSLLDFKKSRIKSAVMVVYVQVSLHRLRILWFNKQ